MRAVQKFDEQTDENPVLSTYLQLPVMAGSCYRVKTLLKFFDPAANSVKACVGLVVPSLSQVQDESGSYIALTGMDNYASGANLLQMQVDANLTLCLQNQSDLGIIQRGESLLYTGAVGGVIAIKYRSNTNGEKVILRQGSFLEIELIV